MDAVRCDRKTVRHQAKSNYTLLNVENVDLSYTTYQQEGLLYEKTYKKPVGISTESENYFPIELF
ncbi:hypothetical protein ACQKNB_16010 [Lysinibacillus xylanilyticus]|uniref:hypothetical protein n=1 Tax=Lysinibacillus xylanilyticus TaxID=582475 RepID=UPI003D017266